MIDDIGYIGTNDGLLYKTTNNGEYWSYITNVGGSTISLTMYNKNIFCAGRVDSYFLYSLDGGVSINYIFLNAFSIQQILLQSPTEIIILSQNKNINIVNILTNTYTTLLQNNFLLSFGILIYYDCNKIIIAHFKCRHL
jgi:hypothetical protein